MAKQWTIQERVLGQILKNQIDIMAHLGGVKFTLPISDSVKILYEFTFEQDGFAETRAQLDELAPQAEGSHRQHMEGSDG